MVFSLAARVSAVGDAERVRFLHLPANDKTYFMYVTKSIAGTFRFYYKELPPLASLTPSFFPVVGSEYSVAGEINRVDDFDVIPDGVTNNAICLYSNGEEIWRFVFDVIAGSIIESPHKIFDGRSPVLVDGQDLYTLYIKGSAVKLRTNFSAEQSIVNPSGFVIDSFSAIAENAVNIRYTGSHSRAKSLIPLRQADGYTDLIYLLTNLPPTSPEYPPQNLVTGQTVSILPTTPSVDPEGFPVVYSSIILPPGLSISPSTGEIYGTVTQIDQENSTSVIRVQDNILFTDTVVYLQEEMAVGGTKEFRQIGADKYAIHTFLNGGTFTANMPIEIEYLIVAGGGGGGGGLYHGAGGGAGGLLTNVGGTAAALPAGSYTVVVGAGGGPGSNGQNSSFNSLIALGGGAGGRQGVSGSSGGSGGGAGYGASFGAGTTGQGNNGGDGFGGGAYGSGGGGGAAEAGANGTGSVGGKGGNGLEINMNGTPTYYAGGGGGSAYDGIPGSGGLGGGGTGARATAAPFTATSGLPNTGGGGGGAERSNATAGSGGSGVVIIRYKI